MRLTTKFSIGALAAGLFAVSCSDVRREPGTVYMPDMAYSRAYETYADHSNLDKQGIFYNNLPVAGTIARGEEMPFTISKDAPGDSAGYVASKTFPNPLNAPLTDAELKETARLFLINCGICHGADLKGNGPLYKGGNGPFSAAPKNLITLQMPDGQMFYSITYGKNMMGSYASQVTRRQRWMIIKYIRSKQAEAAGPAKSDSTKGAVAPMAMAAK